MPGECGWCLEPADTPVVSYGGWTVLHCPTHARVLVDPLFTPDAMPTPERLELDRAKQAARIDWTAYA